MSEEPAADDCKAVREGGFLRCDRCDQHWPAEDPTRPPCSPITFGEMRFVALEAADEIEGFQKRQVAAGFRKEPSWEALYRVRRLRRLARLIDRLVARPEALGLLSSSSVRGAAPEKMSRG